MSVLTYRVGVGTFVAPRSLWLHTASHDMRASLKDARKRLVTAYRGTEEVLDDHLQLRLMNEVEKDIERNYPADIVAVTNHGVFRGQEGIRECARRLAEKLPEARFEYVKRLVYGEIALLKWRATSSNGYRVEDGVDTFVIRNGRIVAKTVHYTLLRVER
jgi:predicted SnoaL-like aldol condensation-catalyzing enzyme